jgi:transcriptional regulator with XRE-family HTH domain
MNLTLIDPKMLGFWARCIREAQHLSQEALAANASVDIRTVQRFEAGKAVNITSRRALAKAMGYDNPDVFDDPKFIPLLGTRRVKDLTKTDINKVIKAGKTRVSVKTKKLRGKAIARGGAGTATRTVGLLGGILTYAVEAGIIESNPAHGIRKPKDNVRKRRLSAAESYARPVA